MVAVGSTLGIAAPPGTLPVAPGGAVLRDGKGGTGHPAGTLALPPPSRAACVFCKSPGRSAHHDEAPVLFHLWREYGNCAWTAATQALPFIHMKNQPCHRQSETIRQRGVM